MKKTILLLLLLASVQADAQYMNKGIDLLGKPVLTVMKCPFCGREFTSLKRITSHVEVCDYRFCIEYHYDASGNRIRRIVTWTVAPESGKKLNATENK